LIVGLAALATAACASSGPTGPVAAVSPSDRQLDAAFETLAAYPQALRIALRAMPKGGDLHNHLGGSIYAEDAIAWAAEAGGCLDSATMTIGPPPCTGADKTPLAGLETRDSDLYSRAVDSLSTRSIEEGLYRDRVPGRDRFFSTFSRFSWGFDGRDGDMIAVAREQAAFGTVGYLELQSMPSSVRDVVAAAMADGEPWSEATLEARWERLQPTIEAAVAAGIAETAAAYERADALNGCDASPAPPACAVEARLHAMALRVQPAPNVFAQLAFAFALVEADPRYVGVNIAAPEHDPVAVRDYDLHMRLFAFMAERHPDVKMSLHAGELAPGLVPPRDLRDHIRAAIEVAGADRIGHGVDIAGEDDAVGLLRHMAAAPVPVEINLTSNDTILGVRGEHHPLHLYLAHGVPVVLSTDDEGVSRGSLSAEYERAVLEQGLSYTQLRAISRASLAHAFIEGDSLLQPSGEIRPECRPDIGGEPSPVCAAVLDTSEKARLQWRLETELRSFERELMGSTLPSAASSRSGR
jgi:adenosine deaminase